MEDNAEHTVPVVANDVICLTCNNTRQLFHLHPSTSHLQHNHYSVPTIIPGSCSICTPPPVIYSTTTSQCWQ